MSIATEITRLQNAKASIKTSIEAKGVTVPSSAKLDSYSSYVDQISGGGGTSKLPSVIDGSVTTLTASDFGNITTIREDIFKNCTSLTSVTISDIVTTIGNNTFKGCSSLASVSLPASLTTIGEFAFRDCPLLTSLTFRGTTTQFANVTLGVGWRYNTHISVVHCTDDDYSIPLIVDIHWNNYIINDYNWFVYDNNIINGSKVWWNGEQLQCDNKIYNTTTNTWKSKNGTQLNVWYYDGNYYAVTGSNQVRKYNATSSHASSSSDYYTTLNVHTPYSSGNYCCEIKGDIYYMYNGKGYKWLGENDGFDTTETFSLPVSYYSGWNVWSPDNGQHYFLNGSSTSSYATKCFLWDDTNKTFVAWNDTTIQCQGMGFFYYDNKLYYAQYGSSSTSIYEATIDYNNQTITFTLATNFTGVPPLTTGPDKFWDFNGTRVLSAVGLRPRHTN